MKPCDDKDCGEKLSATKIDTRNSHDHHHDGDDHQHHHNDNPNQLKKDVVFIAISVIIALAAAIFAQSALQKVLFISAIIISGLPIFLQGFKNITKFDLEEQSLLTIAVIAAVIIGELPEAVIVTILFKVGEMLEGIAVSRSQRELEAVTKIMPENANLILEDSRILVVGSKSLELGSRILIKSGEKVPVDAVILSGSSSIDSAALTGESAAREVFPGDRIMSGSINIGGALTCQTTSGFDDSTAGKIISLVKDAAAKKGNVERFLSRFSRVYTPIVILAAIVVAVLPPLLGFGSFTIWISRALVFLVASCPCALVISIPLSFFAGIGGASKQGILIKGSKYIEVLAKAKAVVFDKTGTLTTGKLAVADIYAIPGYTKDRVLGLAATCEMMSTHPIAKAVVAAYGIPDTSKLEDSQEITSYGMKGQIDGKTVLCGSKRLMEMEGISLENFPSANIYVAVEGTAVGSVSVFDKPRAEAKDSIAELKNIGIIQAAMLTGDSQAAAIKVQQLTGIDRFDCDLLPQDKVEKLLQIKESFGITLFVGDGINDAPVLAAADAGIAMGIGSDAAIEAADIVLLSDKLTSLPQAIRIARRTTNLAKFNMFFALGIKLVVFILAFFGAAQMWMAVMADVGVSIICVLNATRALRFK